MSTLIQQSDEWHSFRSDKIGASDAPVIMEVSPWNTPYKLWEQKLTGKKTKKNFSQQRGLTLEEKAREKLSEMTDTLWAPNVCVHPKREWMMASLDAMDIDKKAIAEIKCPGKEDHKIAQQGKIPDHYYPQLQHQMEVCELGMAYYFSFDGKEGVLLEIERDDQYIRFLLEKEQEFLDCIKNFIPPKMNNKDYVNRECLQWNESALKFKQIKSQLTLLYEEQKELEDFFKSMSQDQNSFGSGIKVTKYLRKGNVEYSSIPELENVDLEKYRKPCVECWKISVD